MPVNGRWISWSLVQDPNNFNITESGCTPMTDDEISKVARDAFKHGTGFMRDGKHVPLEDVYMTAGDVATDDLVKRLRNHCFSTDWQVAVANAREAADRIEEQDRLIVTTGKINIHLMECAMEQKLRIGKLEAALRRISDDGNWDSAGCWDAMSYPDEIARVALGEEEEEDDD